MRGIAIMGVLLAQTVWNLGGPPQSEWNAFDGAVAVGMDLFVDGRFLSLFACLFGVGVALQWARWERSGSDVVRLHFRRMGFLLAIGLLHGALLRNGDILAPYAILGFLLLPLRRVKTPWLIALALFLIWVPYLANTVVRAAGLEWPARPEGIEGGYLLENWAWLKYWYLTNPLRSWPTILALMLAGVLLARSGGVRRLASDRTLAGRALWISLSIAAVSRVTFEVLTRQGTLEGTGEAGILILGWLGQIATWSLAGTYGALFLYLNQIAWTSNLLSLPRSVGRMAFTNYLTQSIVIVPLCLAFGWFDLISPGRGLILALCVGALQTVFTLWWLKRHPMGPFERLWRRATYGNSSAPS